MEWYYAESGQQRGPVNEEEFERLVAAGTIRDDTLVWKAGMPNWQPYGTVKPAPAGSAAPAPPAPPLAPPAGVIAGPSFDADQARRIALGKVSGPAIGLIVTAILGFVGALFGMLGLALGHGAFPAEFPVDPQFERLLESMRGTLGIVNTVVVAALSTLVLFGALKMRRLESYGLSVAAAVVALIPCTSPCCCLGLPFGIWALVVLNQSDVRSQFR